MVKKWLLQLILLTNILIATQNATPTDLQDAIPDGEVQSNQDEPKPKQATKRELLSKFFTKASKQTPQDKPSENSNSIKLTDSPTLRKILLSFPEWFDIKNYPTPTSKGATTPETRYTLTEDDQKFQDMYYFLNSFYKIGPKGKSEEDYAEYPLELKKTPYHPLKYHILKLFLEKSDLTLNTEEEKIINMALDQTYLSYLKSDIIIGKRKVYSENGSFEGFTLTPHPVSKDAANWAEKELYSHEGIKKIAPTLFVVKKAPEVYVQKKDDLTRMIFGTKPYESFIQELKKELTFNSSGLTKKLALLPEIALILDFEQDNKTEFDEPKISIAMNYYYYEQINNNAYPATKDNEGYPTQKGIEVTISGIKKEQPFSDELKKKIWGAIIPFIVGNLLKDYLYNIQKEKKSSEFIYFCNKISKKICNELNIIHQDLPTSTKEQVEEDTSQDKTAESQEDTNKTGMDPEEEEEEEEEEVVIESEKQDLEKSTAQAKTPKQDYVKVIEELITNPNYDLPESYPNSFWRELLNSETGSLSKLPTASQVHAFKKKLEENMPYKFQSAIKKCNDYHYYNDRKNVFVIDNSIMLYDPQYLKIYVETIPPLDDEINELHKKYINDEIFDDIKNSTQVSNTSPNKENLSSKKDYFTQIFILDIAEYVLKNMYQEIYTESQENIQNFINSFKAIFNPNETLRLLEKVSQFFESVPSVNIYRSILLNTFQTKFNRYNESDKEELFNDLTLKLQDLLSNEKNKFFNTNDNISKKYSSLVDIQAKLNNQEATNRLKNFLHKLFLQKILEFSVDYNNLSFLDENLNTYIELDNTDQIEKKFLLYDFLKFAETIILKSNSFIQQTNRRNQHDIKNTKEEMLTYITIRMLFQDEPLDRYSRHTYHLYRFLQKHKDLKLDKYKEMFIKNKNILKKHLNNLLADFFREKLEHFQNPNSYYDNRQESRVKQKTLVNIMPYLATYHENINKDEMKKFFFISSLKNHLIKQL